jgi:DNA-binding NtrC family response regulator
MSKNRILVIEDDAPLGAMIQEIFNSCFGRDSVVVGNRACARDLLAQGGHDLVISELFVAGESVLCLAREFGGNPSCGLFIFFSNFEMDVSAKSLKDKRFFLIRKPHIFQLVDRISQLMSWPIKK